MNYYSLILCFTLSIFANETKQFVQLNEADVVILKDSKYVTITLPFEVLSTYHIQSNSDASDGSIPTEITFKENDNYEIKSQEFSVKNDETIFLNGDMHKVISNRFEVTVILKLNKNVSNFKLEGALDYQACTDRLCLFPRTLNFQTNNN